MKLSKLRVLALVFGAILLSGSATATSGCGDDEPQYCSDYSTLQDSIDELTDIQINTETISEFESDLATVQDNAETLAESARSDFPEETEDLEAAIDGTVQSVQDLPESPSTQEYLSVGLRVAELGQAASRFRSTTESACD